MSTEEISTFINKIPQTASIRNFIIKSKWCPNEITLQILDSSQSNSWEGTISIDDLKQSSNELEIPYSKFYDECKEAITHNGGVEHFEYSVEDDKFTLTKNDEFRIQYLEVELNRDYDLQQSVLVDAVDLIASLRSKLSTMEQNCKDIKCLHQTTANALEKCLEDKNKIENKLLRKFTVLLNSKKDKIAELQSLYQEKDVELDDAGLSSQPSKRKSTEMIGDSSNRYDNEFMEPTQVMTQPLTNLPKRKKFNAEQETIPRKVTGDTLSSRKNSLEKDTTDDTINDSPDIFDQL